MDIWFALRATSAFMTALFVLFMFGFFAIAAKEVRHAYGEVSIVAQLKD